MNENRFTLKPPTCSDYDYCSYSRHWDHLIRLFLHLSVLYVLHFAEVAFSQFHVWEIQTWDIGWVQRGRWEQHARESRQSVHLMTLRIVLTLKISNKITHQTRHAHVFWCSDAASHVKFNESIRKVGTVS